MDNSLSPFRFAGENRLVFTKLDGLDRAANDDKLPIPARSAYARRKSLLQTKVGVNEKSSKESSISSHFEWPVFTEDLGHAK